ncbi:hypothetical protein C8F01DRAFT_1112347 [Mycena amicta]|nr:hypothetical protein C8F01DRAFT_1112347 [Mycena amicta]
MVRLAVSISLLVALCGARGALTASTTTNTTLSSLPDFIHEVFAQLTSTNDTVSDAALNNFYSPDLQASAVATSSNLNHTAFGELVQGLRAELAERQLKLLLWPHPPIRPTRREPSLRLMCSVRCRMGSRSSSLSFHSCASSGSRTKRTIREDTEKL